MRPDHTAQCRRWFLAEIEAGAMPDMAAVFAGIPDIRTVLHWAKKDPEFDAEWGRAAGVAKRREQLAERSKCPDAIVEWLRAHGGKADITLRKLGAELGFSAPRVHRAVQHLAATSIVRADFRTRGTVLELICPSAVSPPVAAADATDVPVASVIEWLRRRGGKAEVSMRKLGANLNCSCAKAHKDVWGLAALGILKVVPGKRGTLLELTRPVAQSS